MIETSHLDRRYQIFISSTRMDLIDERDELSKALNLNNYIAEGMELFPAADEDQWEIIKDKMKESDIYVVIVADRYGSIADTAFELEPNLVKKGEKISYTHLEFRLAKSLGLPVLAFIKTGDRTDKDVDVFVDELMSHRMITYWKTTTELVAKVISAVNKKAKNPAFAAEHGWIRASSLKTPEHREDATVKLISKIHYVKLISHSDRRYEPKPLYSKKIERNGNIIDIWDEYVTVTAHNLSHYVDGFQYYVSTKGDGVDFTSLFPFVNKFEFSDYNEGAKDTIFNPKVTLPSNAYVHAVSYYNGFQHGNTEFATKATKFTKELKLIVDFTSISKYKERFRFVSCVEVSASGASEADITESAREVTPGIFMVERTNVENGKVIKLYFDLL